MESAADTTIRAIHAEAEVLAEWFAARDPLEAVLVLRLAAAIIEGHQGIVRRSFRDLRSAPGAAGKALYRVAARVEG